jgi:hypothetical protein
MGDRLLELIDNHSRYCAGLVRAIEALPSPVGSRTKLVMVSLVGLLEGTFDELVVYRTGNKTHPLSGRVISDVVDGGGGECRK